MCILIVKLYMKFVRQPNSQEVTNEINHLAARFFHPNAYIVPSIRILGDYKIISLHGVS